jgi:hypothetical protein
MIVMDELDLAFLVPAEAPKWQPLAGADVAAVVGEWPATMTEDDGWTEIALQFELDRVWAEMEALFV